MEGYIDELSLFRYQEVIEESNIQIEQMLQESEFLLTSFINGEPVLEAAPNDNGKKKNVFVRIIEFIKNIISKFIDKANVLTQANEKFISRNEKYLSADKLKGLAIQMTPYWKQPVPESIFKTIDGNVSRITKNPNKDMVDIDNMKKEVAGKYLDKNDNLTQGLKNYFRTGQVNKESDKVEIAANNLATLINNTFIPYVKNYKGDTVPRINEMNRRINSFVDIAERELGKRETSMESTMCLLENTTYGETEFGALFLVTEARTESDKDIKKAKENSSPSKVESRNYKTEQERELSTNVRGMDGDSLKVFTNGMKILQTVISVVMTIMEEKNTAYMGAIKEAVSHAKGNSSNEEPSTTSQSADNSI